MNFIIKLIINNPLSNIVKLKNNRIAGIFKDKLYIFSFDNNFSSYKLEKQIDIDNAKRINIFSNNRLILFGNNIIQFYEEINDYDYQKISVISFYKGIINKVLEINKSLFAFINDEILYFYNMKTIKKEYEAKNYNNLYLFKNDILCLTQKQIKLFLMDIKTKEILFNIEIGYSNHFRYKIILDLINTGGDNFLIISEYSRAGRGTWASLYILTEFLKNDNDKYVEGSNIEI